MPLPGIKVTAESVKRVRRPGETMKTKNILYFGKDEPLPERIPLHAGPLNLFFEQGDLRYIRFGEREILRRIYVAIRDRNWGTILPKLFNLSMDIQEDSFGITFDVENKRGEIDFAWKGKITGNAQGEILFSMQGQARSTFLRNRIGFCVLYPAACAGAAAHVDHMDGQTERGTFPELICADQPVLPFAEMRSLTHQVTPDSWAKVSFAGDIFEMEDQRNWTDASYKVFSTPLRLPYPVSIENGTQIEQAITLTLLEERKAPTKRTGVKNLRVTKTMTFRLQTEKTCLLPQIGLNIASHGQPLMEIEISRLKALHLDHLRVDLKLSEDRFLTVLERAAAQAKAIGVSLYAALLIGEGAGEALPRLKYYVKDNYPPVKTWLVYPESESFSGGSPTHQVVELARKHLSGVVPGARFAAGTNTDLIFLQRTPPPTGLLDWVTFAINPQVHAFDNASLVETLEAQGAAVKTAYQLSGGKPVMVSPVTLKPTHNAYATGPALSPGALPPQVDPRQMSLLGAGWTAGSLKYLSESHVQCITFYETTGWRGVMETQAGSSLPEAFHSVPGSVFPLYHVLADFGEFAGGEVIYSRSSNNLVIDGICIRKDGKRRIILANTTAEPQSVSIQGLAGSIRVRMLDETNAEEAMLAPEKFRSKQAERIRITDNTLRLTLLPYAVARIDG
jgi:hypothetical protein